MEEFFTSGRAIDVILAVMVIEAILLIVYRTKTRSGPTVAQTVSNIASGAMIMLAVRSALTGAGWEQTAMFLLAAFVAHLVDLKLRLGAAN